MIPGLVFPCYIPFLSFLGERDGAREMHFNIFLLLINIVDFSIIFEPNIYHDHTHFLIHLTINEI